MEPYVTWRQNKSGYSKSSFLTEINYNIIQKTHYFTAYSGFISNKLSKVGILVLDNYVYSATYTIIQINAVPGTLFQIKVICNALGLITSVLYAV